MMTLAQDRFKRHSSGYGEERSDLYGSYDSYGYSSGGGGGYSCGCCPHKQDLTTSSLLPILLAGVAAAAGYFFGRDSNNNNGRSLGVLPSVSAHTAQVILDGESLLLSLSEHI